MNDSEINPAAEVQTSGVSISSIVIEGLFGDFSYQLCPTTEAVDPNRLLILYGENGTGKTTLLWLVYHLLSREVGGGHRSFVARVPFRLFEVNLSDSSVVRAERRNAEYGPYTMSIKTPFEDPAYLELIPDELGRVSIEGREEEATAFLAKLPQLNLFFLPDNRRTIESSRQAVNDGEYRIPRRMALYEKNRKESIKQTPIEVAIATIDQRIRSYAWSAANEGQVNVNSVYTDLAHRISTTRDAKSSAPPSSADDLIQTLSELSVRTALYSELGLSPVFAVDELVEDIERNRHWPETLMILQRVLQPYIQATSARLQALEKVQHSLSTLLTTVNSFLVSKTVAFHVKTGLTIHTRTGQLLHPRLLSSGEKELLLLFINIVIAKGSNSIFIIDEPELSLNITWQRKLLDSLLSVAGSDSIQFLLATHSVELLAQRRNNVVRLKP